MYQSTSTPNGRDGKAATLADVARVAGVSKATAAQVCRGDGRISLPTQERVRRAAAELEYRPNHFARSLITGRTNTIGLMISGLRNPFFLELMETAERFIIEAGYQTILDAAPSERGTYMRHGKLSGWPVDGVLMWAMENQKLSDFLGAQAAQAPVVYLSSNASTRDVEDGSDCVSADVYVGARQAIEHVLARGYRRIAYVGPHKSHRRVPYDLRLKAYHDVCREAGLRLETIVTERHEETREAGWHAGQALAALPPSRRPQALLCHNDVIAVSIYHGLRRGRSAGAEVRVPEDIAVVGFDGIEEARFLDKPLTTVHMPIEELCRRAVEILLRRVAGASDFPPQRIVVPAQLWPGETT